MNRILGVVVTLLAVIVIAIIGMIVLSALWNYAVAAVFGLPEITWGQMGALVFLIVVVLGMVRTMLFNNHDDGL